MQPTIDKAVLWSFTKWAAMTVVIFWTIVFKLSAQGVRLPEFVYVNF